MNDKKDLPDLPFTAQFKCLICGYRTKGFKDFMEAHLDMSNHLVTCLRLFDEVDEGEQA